jgi:cytochrome c biogenesis protein ResB
MAEKDQENTFDLNKILFTREGTLRREGQILAFIGLLAMLVVVCVAVLTNHDWVAGLLGTGTIIAVVAMFLRRNAVIKSNDTEIQINGGDDD